jgi:hypothetical protein
MLLWFATNFGRFILFSGVFNTENKTENMGTVHGPKLASGYSPWGPAACAAWQPTRPNGPWPSQSGLAPRRPGRPSHSARHAGQRGDRGHGCHSGAARGGIAVSAMVTDNLSGWSGAGQTKVAGGRRHRGAQHGRTTARTPAAASVRWWHEADGGGNGGILGRDAGARRGFAIEARDEGRATGRSQTERKRAWPWRCDSTQSRRKKGGKGEGVRLVVQGSMGDGGVGGATHATAAEEGPGRRPRPDHGGHGQRTAAHVASREMSESWHVGPAMKFNFFLNASNSFKLDSTQNWPSRTPKHLNKIWLESTWNKEQCAL